MKPLQLDRSMLLGYIDQRRAHIEAQMIEAPEDSRAELYWMAAHVEATSLRNAIYTGNYNLAIDLHHKSLVPTRRGLA